MIAMTLGHPAMEVRFTHYPWQSEGFDSTHLAHKHPHLAPRLSASANELNFVRSYLNGVCSASSVRVAVLTDCSQPFRSAAEITRFVATILRRETR